MILTYTKAFWRLAKCHKQVRLRPTCLTDKEGCSQSRQPLSAAERESVHQRAAGQTIRRTYIQYVLDDAPLLRSETDYHVALLYPEQIAIHVVSTWTPQKT